MNQTEPMNRRDLETRIIAKAWQDEKFKQELLQNPTETIMKELGLQYSPDRPTFKVLEETPDVLYLVLPMTPKQIASLTEGEDELSNEELRNMVKKVVMFKCSPSSHSDED